MTSSTIFGVASNDPALNRLTVVEPTAHPALESLDTFPPLSPEEFDALLDDLFSNGMISDEEVTA